MSQRGCPAQNIIRMWPVVRFYPVEERHGLIWVWMGDAKSRSRRDIYVEHFGDPLWGANHCQKRGRRGVNRLEQE